MAYEAIIAWLRKTWGLEVSEAQREVLERYIEGRMNALGAPSESAFLELMKDAQTDPETERQQLLREAVVGESYFFRFRPQLELIRKTLLPRHCDAAKKSGERAVVWSAACARGEEPYTLAIIAAELGLLDRVSVVATDISAHHLVYARRGIYRERAVRQVPPDLRERYFRRHEDGEYHLVDRIRNAVSFEEHNLVSAQPAPLPSAARLALCRNVLIYFGAEASRQASESLRGSMHPRGTLLLGHADLVPESLQSWKSRVSQLTLFETPVTAVEAPPEHERKVREEGPALSNTRAERAAVTPRGDRSSIDPLPPLSLGLKQAEDAAGRGDGDFAQRLLERLAAGHPESTDAWYLLGAVHSSDALAIDALRKALFFAPDHVAARFHMAKRLHNRGAVADALRELGILDRHLQRYPEGEIEVSGGYRVHDLSRLSESLRSALQHQA